MLYSKSASNGVAKCPRCIKRLASITTPSDPHAGVVDV